MSVDFTPRQREIAERWSNLNVLVVGDVMADIKLDVLPGPPSPEGAGTLFVERERTLYPGGAANVAMNCAALGARVTLLGAIGMDAEGERLISRLTYHKVRYPWGSYVARQMEWEHTTTKTRIYREGQMLYRLDRDMNYRLPAEALFSLLQNSSFDLMLLSDYQKGAFSDARGWGVGNLTAVFRERNPNGYVGINPKPQLCCTPWFLDATFDLVSFNQKEFIAMYTLSGRDWSQDHPIARTMRYMLLTSGREGLTLWNRQTARAVAVPARPVSTPNVVGAGDATFAAAGMALAVGCSEAEIAGIANAAGASKCTKDGTSPADLAETLSCV